MKDSISTIDLDDPNCVVANTKGRSLGYFCQQKPLRVTRVLLNQLKERVKEQGGKNLRLCLHEGPEALFHEMIILEHVGQYFPPHKHREKGESWHVIEGKMAAFVFQEDGKIIDATVLDSEDTFLYRVDANMYHMVVPLSGAVMYHESKPGPFLGPGDSIFAPWAPNVSDQAGLEQYVAKILEQLNSECWRDRA